MCCFSAGQGGPSEAARKPCLRSTVLRTRRIACGKQDVREHRPLRHGFHPGLRQRFEPGEWRERTRGTARGRGSTQHGEQVRRECGRKSVSHARQLGFERCPQQAVDSRTQPLAIRLRKQLRQPDLPRAQHVGEEACQPARLVIERTGKPLERRGAFVAGFQGFHEPTRGLAIKRPRIVDQRGRQANAGGQWQSLREPVVEPVDGLHVQARRVTVEVPAARPALRQRGHGQGVQFLPVGGRARRDRLAGVCQRAHDAVPHLGGRLARERDGDDLLRAVHGGKQPQVAECQQAGLAGTRGGLDDEGPARVDGFSPRVGVAIVFSLHRPPPPAHRRGNVPYPRGTTHPDGSACKWPPPASGPPRRGPQRSRARGLRARPASAA